MSIVEVTQQRMFAFPAGQAARRGQLSRRSEWKGQRNREGRGLQLKRGKGVLFLALSYRHLKAGGLLQTFEAW